MPSKPQTLFIIQEQNCKHSKIANMYTYLHKMKIDSDTGLNHKPYIFNNKIVNTQKSIHIWKVKVCQNESFCSNIWKKRLRTTYVYLIRAERRWKRCEFMINDYS